MKFQALRGAAGVTVCVLFAAVAGCKDRTSAFGSREVGPKVDAVTMWVRYPAADRALDPAAALGKKIFVDRSLSASGRMACASCHDPDHAYGPPNALAVQPGGPDLQKFGMRAVPSLRYLQFTPKFTRHLAQPSPDGVEDEGPAGGFTRDGAAQTLHEQALLPLMNPVEMANPSIESINAKLRNASYAEEFRRVFGADVFDHPGTAVAFALSAIESFETQDPTFQPYTSKFDAVMSGNAAFSDAELRGYKTFNDPQKGNCAKCHLDAPGPGGRPAQFTDFGHVAIGVPRNPEIEANRDKAYFDLGLCGPARTDLAKESDLCGMFKTPTLRNVATRKVFFHNGRFKTLDEVVHFYAERDTDPAKWYAAANGRATGADDLPDVYLANVDRVDVPFTRKVGEAPLLSRADIEDLLAFLATLDDDYSAQPGGKAKTQGGARSPQLRTASR